MIEIHPVAGLPELAEGDDLAKAIVDRFDLRDGDVVAVASKVVAKIEGAVVRLPPGADPVVERRRLAAEVAREIVAEAPWALIVRTGHGFVCANAGIDASNAPDGTLVLLPVDPDASARHLRDALRERSGADVGVVVTDTFGRPWRNGQTDVALGVAGVPPIRDERGGVDREGRPLTVTEVAVADELAAAADLVRRKADGVPVAVVRGHSWTADPEARAAALVRDPATDLFRRGTGMLATALAATPSQRWGGGVEDHDRRKAEAAAVRMAGSSVSVRWTGAVPATARVRGRAAARGVAAGIVAAVLADAGYVIRLESIRGATYVTAGRPPAGGATPRG